MAVAIRNYSAKMLEISKEIFLPSIPDCVSPPRNPATPLCDHLKALLQVILA